MDEKLRLAGSVFLLVLSTLACRPGTAPPPPSAVKAEARLPTGVHLDPAGPSFDVGNMPLAVLPAPGPAGRFVLLLSGWREEGLQVVDASQGRVVQTLPQAGAFLGLVFSHDGHTLYTSGGDDDAVWRYEWDNGTAVFRGRFELAPKEKGKNGSRYPAGLALSPDGSLLYVAENLADTLAVLDVTDGRVVQRLPVGRFPYGVVVAPGGAVWASAWGTDQVVAFAPDSAGSLRETGRVAAGRHPSALLLNRSGSRLFAASASTDRVAVVDTRTKKVIATLQDPPPSGPDEGSTPNALALDPSGARLYVAEADNNAVAVFDLSAATAGIDAARGNDRLAGRIPCQWYPTALALSGDTGEKGGALVVVNGKGRGAGPSLGRTQPDKPLDKTSTSYTLGQLNGTVTVVPAATLERALPAFTRRVEHANGWDVPRPARRYPPFEHVVYILKENRTYDQVFGDLPQGDGDPSLVFFPRAVSPNHHALAERFGLYDRFFVNAEVSNQGHPWSTSGYVTDYMEKTTPADYSDRRDDGDVGEADEPAGGWLWGIAREKGISFRNYGETMEKAEGPGGATVWKTKRQGLAEVSHLQYPGWDLSISDQVRADLWIADLKESEKQGEMPALQLLWLPNDHTSGAAAGKPTPRAYMADNDYALARIVAALSHSRFWKSTVVFVLEDDAQSGPDHVDSHRSVLLVLSPYNRPGIVHRFANTSDVLATIEGILGLRSFSHFDWFGRPLADVFAAEPDLRPYDALPLAVPWTELNPPKTPAAATSARLDLSIPDSGQDALFNAVLWRAIKRDAPYPEARRMPLLELERGR